MTRCASAAWLVLALCPIRAEATESSQLLVRQGISQFNYGLYQQALGTFLEVLELDPKDEKALYYQARAASALSEQRRAQIRKESLEVARNSLDQAERVKLAGILCERGQRALKAGDLLLAGRLFAESRAAFARHSCVAIGLMMTRQALDKKRVLAEASSQELQLLAESSISGEGAWSAATQAPLPAASYGNRPGARSALAEPLAEPVFGSRLPPAPRPTRRLANAPTQFPMGRSTGPSGPGVPSPQDLNASEELYLLAVADYMAGDSDKALESLRKALKLNPNNARAKNLFQRIELEER